MISPHIRARRKAIAVLTALVLTLAGLLPGVAAAATSADAGVLVICTEGGLIRIDVGTGSPVDPMAFAGCDACVLCLCPGLRTPNAANVLVLAVEPLPDVPVAVSDADTLPLARSVRAPLPPRAPPAPSIG